MPYEKLEEALKNLTLRGVTILASTGDAGASGSAIEIKKCNPKGDPLVGNQVPQWPAVSPWVTTVGATQFLATKNNPQTEVACSYATRGGITSGGGFAGPEYPSDLFSMPAWQKTVVGRYLAENNASNFAGFPTAETPGYNPNGRAYPDIAAYGAYFPILGYTGEIQAQAGTSLFAPMASALFTLANQELLQSGYEVIGYANPMLYWMGENCAEAFKDIVDGDNQAGRRNEKCLFGFPAAPGWDAATGLGSINFRPFVQCAKRYQDEVRSKGLEMLPDGSYLEASSPPGDTKPPSTPSMSSPTSSSPAHSSLIGLFMLCVVCFMFLV